MKIKAIAIIVMLLFLTTTLSELSIAIPVHTVTTGGTYTQIKNTITDPEGPWGIIYGVGYNEIYEVLWNHTLGLTNLDIQSANLTVWYWNVEAAEDDKVFVDDVFEGYLTRGSSPGQILSTLITLSDLTILNDGIIDINVTIEDDFYSSIYNSTLTVEFAPVVADINGPYTGDEGSSITLDASGSSGSIVLYEWDLDYDGEYDDATGVGSSYTWGDDGIFTIGLQVTDVFGNTDTDTTTVAVQNVAPSTVPFGPYTVDEGSPITLTATATDLGSDDLGFLWEWGDGTFVASIWTNDGLIGDDPDPSPDGNYPFQIIDQNEHTYGDNGVYTVTLTVSDDDGGETEYLTTVTVYNVAPVITVGGDTINENDWATVAGTINDPSILDTFDATIDWGDGAPESYTYTAGSTTFSETHQYLDDNPTGTPSDVYTIMVTIADDDGDSDTESTTVTMNNVNPIVIDIIMDQPNQEFILPFVHEMNFTGPFTDVGTLDTHTAIWDWGDTTTTPGTVDESGGSGTVTGTHTYSAPGVYTVTLTVADDDTGVGTNTMTVNVVTVEEAKHITEQVDVFLEDGVIDNEGVANGLSKKLENIQAKIDQGKFKAALGQLKAFIKMVQAQMGKHITVDAANTLIASAQALIDTL